MRFHTHLPVQDIQQTKLFYEKFLGEPPVKVKADYLKFLPGGTELNLCFSLGTVGSDFVSSLHLGFEFESRAALDQAYERLTAAGVAVERRATGICCYADQDKMWARDPNGYEWELYVVLEDSELKAEPDHGCCVGSSACG